MKYINFSQFKHYYILKGEVPYKNNSSVQEILDMLEYEYKMPLDQCESVFFAHTKSNKNEFAVIFHDSEGLVIIRKVFDNGHLICPKGRAGMIELTDKQLELFLSGYPIASSIGH